ncbi:aminopeptidase [Rubeoparvulum massiliense]|uniref:aminopeptidase n=1 Tax=Rubeoparvulum massiliense TaxID=1631346 RepID=UPI00065E35F0|nr:aminopeptidase [Rubeoparvulum massiliense]
MRDPRLTQLAKNLINYSVSLKPGEKILIEMFDHDAEMVKALVEATYEAGGLPFVHLYDQNVQRSLLLGMSEEQAKMQAEWDLERMKAMDAYIGVRAAKNVSQTSDVPSEKNNIWAKFYNHPVHSRERVPHTKWCVLRYPNHSMAQLSKMSTEAFENFYFQVCTLDYSKMDKAMDALVKVMDRTDKVHIKGNGTDLTFSIKDIPKIKCSGHMNIPDGEVYTAPVRDSVNGVVQYNAPSPYHGFVFENVRLRFENGKVVEATSNNTKLLNEILDTDEGARFIGEFAIGVNPYVQHPMGDILFDEKIDGSFHFTPGQSYDEAPNGNNSAIHWDLVCIQRPEYGGGEIYFDDVLIRKDGRFVLPELEILNPENLK